MSQAFTFADYLDRPVEELPDGGKSKLLPAGVHVVEVKNVERKELAKKEAVVFTYSYLECVELVNPSDAVPETGETYQELFFVGSEAGIGALKKHVMPQVVPGTPLSTVLQEVIGGQFKIATTIREWKEKIDGKETGEMKRGHQTKDGLRSL